MIEKICSGRYIRHEPPRHGHGVRFALAPVIADLRSESETKSLGQCTFALQRRQIKDVSAHGDGYPTRPGAILDLERDPYASSHVSGEGRKIADRCNQSFQLPVRGARREMLMHRREAPGGCMIMIGRNANSGGRSIASIHPEI